MLTIFTPTYNRAYILHQAYKSLCRQTTHDFIWLIVDDGSTDETKELVQTWIEENKISIRYYYQPNGGKMRAHNWGVRLCDTELFVCLDSDDYLVDDAVETILTLWNSLEEKQGLAGIVAYKGKDTQHTMFGEAFPEVRIDTLQELYQKGFFGENTLVHRRDVLLQFPFPEIEGEKFIPEAVVYDKIDLLYQLYVFPKILMICKYRNDGLSYAIEELRMNNPKGWLLYYQQKIQYSQVSILHYKYIAHAICFCWRLKLNPFQQIPASKIEIAAGFIGAIMLKWIGKL